MESLDDGELLHVATAALHAVDAQGGIVLSRLLGLDLGQGLDRSQATVLGQRQRDLLKSISEGSEVETNVNMTGETLWG